MLILSAIFFFLYQLNFFAKGIVDSVVEAEHLFKKIWDNNNSQAREKLIVSWRKSGNFKICISTAMCGARATVASPSLAPLVICNRHHIWFKVFYWKLMHRKLKRCIFGQKLTLEKNYFVWWLSHGPVQCIKPWKS